MSEIRITSENLDDMEQCTNKSIEIKMVENAMNIRAKIALKNGGIQVTHTIHVKTGGVK